MSHSIPIWPNYIEFVQFVDSSRAMGVAVVQTCGESILLASAFLFHALPVACNSLSV